MGSDAVAISPDGTSLYVASARSDAIAVFHRNQATGQLTQAPGPVATGPRPLTRKREITGSDLRSTSVPMALVDRH